VCLWVGQGVDGLADLMPPTLARGRSITSDDRDTGSVTQTEITRAVTTVSETKRRRIIDEEEREEGAVAAGVYLRHVQVGPASDGPLCTIATLFRRSMSPAKLSMPHSLSLFVSLCFALRMCVPLCLITTL
jgi:hypothetical protein